MHTTNNNETPQRGEVKRLINGANIAPQHGTSTRTIKEIRKRKRRNLETLSTTQNSGAARFKRNAHRCARRNHQNGSAFSPTNGQSESWRHKIKCTKGAPTDHPLHALNVASPGTTMGPEGSTQKMTWATLVSVRGCFVTLMAPDSYFSKTFTPGHEPKTSQRRAGSTCSTQANCSPAPNTINGHSGPTKYNFED